MIKQKLSLLNNTLKYPFFGWQRDAMMKSFILIIDININDKLLLISDLHIIIPF